MTEQHTPGAWTVRNREPWWRGHPVYDTMLFAIDAVDPRLFGCDDPVEIALLDAGLIADESPESPNDESDAVQRRVIEANARLIAAAPDLLAALEAVEWGGLDALDRPVICPRCAGNRITGHSPGCLLHAAIQKARGEAAADQ